MKRREEYILALILFFTSAAACRALYSFDHHSLIFFGDAVSHIVRARQFIDSQQPGFVNIGTVWLPLPHLLLIPFVAFDSLFYSGIAGAVIGIPLLVATTLLLFSILRSITNSRPVAFFISLLFGLNPNLMYIAVTPMSEMPLLFFITLGGYSMLKWIQGGKKRWILLSAVAVAAATLCRYEAWILAPFVSALVVHRKIRLSKEQSALSGLQTMSIAVIPWVGIFFWFGWNYFCYGDMLKFAHWTYSVGTSAVRVTLRENPSALFSIIGNALLWIFGPMMIGSGLLMVLSVRRLSLQSGQIVILLFFALPALFILAAILAGFVQVDQWWWNWRFVLSFGLFLSTASALALQELFQKFRPGIGHGIVALCFIAMPVVQVVDPSVGVAVYNDAKKSYDEPSRSAAILGISLQSLYHGGTVSVLTGYGLGQRIMISSRLPLRTFNVHYFENGSVPILSDRFIILGKDRTAESEEFSGYWSAQKDSLLLSYTVRAKNRHFVLLEHIDQPMDLSTHERLRRNIPSKGISRFIGLPHP